MITVLLRTVILYITATISLRLMGKRQLGQMRISEFVTAVMLSELAVFPISNTDIPLLYGIIPVVTLATLEITSSLIALKSPFFQNYVEGKPGILIYKGKLCQQEMKKYRITLKELISELRSAGCGCIDDADYVFLEPNGKFSVIPKDSDGAGVDHVMIVDGKVIESGIIDASKSRAWLDRQLSDNGIDDVKSVMYLACNDDGKVTIIRKDKKK